MYALAMPACMCDRYHLTANQVAFPLGGPGACSANNCSVGTTTRVRVVVVWEI